MAQVAAIFKLTREDVSDWQLLTAAVQQMLTSQSSYKAAVHLLMQFEVRLHAGLANSACDRVMACLWLTLYECIDLTVVMRDAVDVLVACKANSSKSSFQSLNVFACQQCVWSAEVARQSYVLTAAQHLCCAALQRDAPPSGPCGNQGSTAAVLSAAHPAAADTAAQTLCDVYLRMLPARCVLFLSCRAWMRPLISQRSLHSWWLMARTTWPSSGWQHWAGTTRCVWRRGSRRQQAVLAEVLAETRLSCSTSSKLQPVLATARRYVLSQHGVVASLHAQAAVSKLFCFHRA